jgi:aspartate carbamoyltransferase regulatory subunit
MTDKEKIIELEQQIAELKEKSNRCMYCEKELKQDEAIVLCKECTE